MKLKQKLSAKLKNQKGFTLIEMLVVVALVAILVMISIPMVTSSLNKAKQATDDANVRAAKAAAAIDYLEDGVLTGNPGYYDAENGVIKASTEGIKDYGQTDANKTKKIVVTESNGVITCGWPE